MSDLTTRRWLSAYTQDSEPTMFFSQKFQVRPENIHASEEVEIDIKRHTEKVAIVVQSLTSDYRLNSDDQFTNKSFKPPIFKEAVPINAASLIKRFPGNNPYQDNNFRAALMFKVFSAIREVERKIRRSIEWQASQILQTGTVTLIDELGNSLYTIDFKPKSSHFPTAGTSWASATLTQKLDNIISLANVIRADGLYNPDQLYFGETDFENLISTTGFSDVRFHADRVNTGRITPMQSVGEGGQYRGVIEIGNYAFDIFTYGGRFEHPQTSASTPFLSNGKVVVCSSSARMDATFGDIPNIGNLLNMQRPILGELPARMGGPLNGVDLHTNVWLSNNGEQMWAGVGSRPLLIPTAIDTYGCLDTQL